METRRFPPPWSAEEDRGLLHRPRRQRLGARLGVYCEEEPGPASSSHGAHCHLAVMRGQLRFELARSVAAASLWLNGSETEAHEIIKHYLSLPGVEIRSIRAFAAWLYLWSDTPFYSAFVKRLSEGLRRAGMPEDLPKINSNGTRVSVPWFAGVLQRLCSLLGRTCLKWKACSKCRLGGGARLLAERHARHLARRAQTLQDARKPMHT